MQKTRGKQNALPAPGLKNMLYKVTSRYTAKLTCCTKMLNPMTETKRGNLEVDTTHTHMICMLGPTPLDCVGAAWDHGFEICECTS
jgi:hypothetical protein